MPRCYVYVVDRDFGFAPNPFHGLCTLATCKPGIRATAIVGDWIIGVGGSRLRAKGRCVYTMRVTEALSFEDYWERPQFRDKRPVRNGSRRMIVGDNIYSRELPTGTWKQSNSHHSNPDGTVNEFNLEHDTRVNRVLISQYFVYYGANAPEVPPELLLSVGYRNRRGYRVFKSEKAAVLIEWSEQKVTADQNRVLGDPFDFARSSQRYAALNNRVLA